MHRKALQLFSLILLSLLTSCGKDEVAPIINEIEFEGQIYKPVYGLILDFGKERETHYNYNFYISDGEITFDGEALDISTDATFFLYAALISEGENEFQVGDFEYGYQANLAGLNIFHTPIMSIREGSRLLRGRDGSISVTGEFPNYTVKYDGLRFAGESLSGEFSGTFTVTNYQD